MVKNKELYLNFIFLVAGAAITAFAIDCFLLPNSIFDGGVSGVSMILAQTFPLKLGILVAVINIPFLLYALRKMGRLFLIKAVVAMLMFSVMLGVFEGRETITNDMLLATVFGGVFLGLGVGLVLRCGGCLDGTEIVGIVLNRKTSISVGQIVLTINIAIYTVAGIRFGISKAMYSLLTYFIASKVIDIVELGFDQAKAVMVITNDGRKIAEAIYSELGRTVTFLQGKGLVSMEGKDVLYCVITRAEIYDIKTIIKKTEEGAFVTISDVSEIVGEHIKSTTKK